MRIRLLFALAVLVLGQFLQMISSRSIGAPSGVDRAAIAIQMTRHSAMPMLVGKPITLKPVKCSGPAAEHAQSGEMFRACDRTLP